MPQDTNTLEGIADIMLPLAPAESSWGLYSIAAIIILFIIIIAILVYQWWHRPRQHCQRQLQNLLQQYQDGQVNSHETAFQLAAILRERLYTRKLCGNTTLPLHLRQHHSRWQTFLNELNSARYAATDIDEPAIGRLANEARFWIRRW